jgi:hypothetical protein
MINSSIFELMLKIGHTICYRVSMGFAAAGGRKRGEG